VLKPILPATADKAERFLGIQLALDKRVDLDGRVLATSYTPLFTRIDTKQIDTMIEASKDTLQGGDTAAAPAAKHAAEAPTPAPAQSPTIAIDDFAKLDLRIGEVLACEFVEGSDKLLRFELDAGPLGRRQIFSGIRGSYGDPPRLVGRKVVFIANLAPRKMRFGLSEGMILSAGFDGSELFLLDVDNGAQPGMPVK
jgi:methionyl-tRNA synthetase